MDLASPPPSTPTITVSASAVMELSALICATCSSRPPRTVLPRPSVDRASRLWGDGSPMLAELVPLAHAVGMLDELDIEPLLERLRDPVPFDGDLPLETEAAGERERINERLRRLARDRRLRTRYVGSLGELWEVFAERWESGGRAEAVAAADAWRAQLAAGTDALELLRDEHIARRPPYDDMTRRAQADGTLHLAPVVAGHYGHIVSVPGLLSVSGGIPEVDAIVARRREATEIADALRVLSEPTRLTILAQLAQRPAGVTELAKTLHIAQPTASVHVRQLRDAGLLESARRGTTTVYGVRPEAVVARLDDLSDRLGRTLTGSGPGNPPGRHPA